MNAAKCRSDHRGEPGIDSAVAQFQFPQGMRDRRKIGHRQNARRLVLAQERRRRTRRSLVCAPHPLGFVAVAADRHAPIGCDPQLPQGPLHADRSGQQVYAPNVGGNATFKGLTGRRGPGGNKAGPGQRDHDVGGDR